MIGGGIWEGAHARHEATGVRHTARRRGGCLAAFGTCAAAGDAAERISESSFTRSTRKIRRRISQAAGWLGHHTRTWEALVSWPIPGPFPWVRYGEVSSRKRRR
jgi:hypothetical protein